MYVPLRHYYKPILWDFETSLRRTKEGFKALGKSSKSICYEMLAVVEIQKLYSKPSRIPNPRVCTIEGERKGYNKKIVGRS